MSCSRFCYISVENQGGVWYNIDSTACCAKLEFMEVIEMKCNSLEEVRSNIDRIDNEIIKLVAERTDYVKQASLFKKSEDGVKAPKRVEAVIQKVREKAAEYGADSDMVEVLYREMISRFVSMEMDEFKKNE